MNKVNKELIGEAYIKKAEKLVQYPHGGGKNDRHWHRDVIQVATYLWQLDDIDKQWKAIVSHPSPNSSDKKAQLEIDRKHVRRQLDARGTPDAIRGKGSSARKR